MSNEISSNWDDKPSESLIDDLRSINQKMKELAGKPIHDIVVEESRLIACACRCQLLVGSFDGDRLCPCKLRSDCPLSEQFREKYYDHPKVKEARQRNLDEFNSKKE